MSGIRVIYAYHVAASKVDFIEIYFKGEKENEDRERMWTLTLQLPSFLPARAKIIKIQRPDFL